VSYEGIYVTITAEHEKHAGAPMMPPVPESGQVVNVRGSTWAVAAVRQQGLPRSPADEGTAGLTHVVSLQSLEEDRLGQELTVVWELEVGHTVAPDQGLPERIDPGAFDDPNTLAAFVDAVRWGAVSSADANSYQAPFRSGANVEAYQLEPLRRALQSSRTNLLLADDVGLGKTIEAGLVIQELLLRHRARSVVIVCPPSLALKWQDEMREKFGLDFVIVNSELLARVRRSHGLAANPFRLFPRVIVSMSWLPTPRAQRLLRDVFADVADTASARRFACDVLVVDEAHHVAPASPTTAPGRRGYAVDSRRTTATKALADKCEHRLFLSATPHNGYSESFTALLEMIDGRRFSRGANLDERALREVAVRRLKSELPEKDFRKRELKPIVFTPSDDEQRQFALLDRILTDSARVNGKGRSGGLVAMLLKKRFLSSPWSFARTLELYEQTASTGHQLDLDEEQYYAEVLGSGQSDEEEGATEHPEFTALRHSKGSDPLVTATGREIESLIEWGSRYEHRPDSRLEALLKFLDATCRPDGRTWISERVVVFTEYAATLEWIVDVLTQRGYRDVLATIQGSTPIEERELIRAQFTEDPAKHPVRVLVATDSAGEGIDLQNHCHLLVNFDIPFNPSRLEQRIGRIDRYGQRNTPRIYRFVPESADSRYARDLRFLVERIADKIGTVAADLGSVNQVVDFEVRNHFDPATGGRKAKPAAPDDGNAVITRALAGGLELNRRLTELSRTYDEHKVEMHLTPANARRVVDAALALTAQPPLLEDFSFVQDTDAAVFTIPGLGSAWQPALRGLDTRLEPDTLRPITFDDKAARGRHDLVHIHLGHALMQRATRVLRSVLFGIDSPVHRVTAVVAEGLPESCVAAVSRLVLVGRGGLRLHEEVFLTGIRVHGNTMSEAKVEEVLDATLDAENLSLAGEDVRTALAGLWNTEDSRLRNRLLTAMARKAESRQAQVTESLQKRRNSDIARVREIFGAFRINLRESRDRLSGEIRAEEEKLFTDDQQAQRRRDLRAMEDRLVSLDDEEQREIAAIGERYRDIRPHVSAAAVVFALTPADAETGKVRA
jgi:superfamily II DNA or RNA helicase